jgi:hypothetical protein
VEKCRVDGTAYHQKALAVRRDIERFGAAKGIELSTVAKSGCGMRQ